jgi:hypothetical protein
MLSDLEGEAEQGRIKLTEDSMPNIYLWATWAKVLLLSVSPSTIVKLYFRFREGA